MTQTKPIISIVYDLKLIKFSGGPDGLRSRGSPIMSRVLYQAELQALCIKIFCQ